jgi:hypothetical protein
MNPDYLPVLSQICTNTEYILYSTNDHFVDVHNLSIALGFGFSLGLTIWLICIPLVIWRRISKDAFDLAQ